MKRGYRFRFLALLLVVFGLAALEGVALQQPSWEAFELVDLVTQRQEADVPFMPFLDRTSMVVGLLELMPGEEDTRPNVPLDEVYYIFEGEGALKVGEQNIDIAPGMVIFTKAGSNGRFTTINQAIQAVVATIKSPSGDTSPASQVFTQERIEATRNPNSNVWNPFLNRPNVTFGLYMLPEARGGDGRLVHTFEELNIITRGSSKFRMDADEVDVQQHSIVFLQAGVGHFFHTLNDDIDILILWS